MVAHTGEALLEFTQTLPDLPPFRPPTCRILMESVALSPSSEVLLASTATSLARHLLPWVLLLLVLAAIPTGIGRSSFSAVPAPTESRVQQLESENARLVEQVRSLATSMDSLRREIGEVRSVATAHFDLLERWPIPRRLEFAGEVVPLEDPQVHVRVEDEWTRYLVNRHWLISWLRRSREVFPVVEAKLAQAGLPDDLKYVVVVESGLRSRAYSPAGAVGYWQFIRATGERYGLQRNSWLDDRRNLESSTDAAIAYLSEMYAEFGSWPLVLSGFNAGERRVRESVEEQGTSNFYDMVLPSETEAYWFRAVVLKELLGHADRYGLHVPEDGWARVATDTLSVRVKSARLDLREICQSTGVAYRQLKELNPQYRRSWLPRGEHAVVLPSQVVPQFVESFPAARVVAPSTPPPGALRASPTSPRP